MKLLTLQEIRKAGNDVADDVQRIRFVEVYSISAVRELVNQLGAHIQILNAVIGSLAEEIYGDQKTGSADNDGSVTDSGSASGNAGRR